MPGCVGACLAVFGALACGRAVSEGTSHAGPSRDGYRLVGATDQRAVSMNRSRVSAGKPMILARMSLSVIVRSTRNTSCFLEASFAGGS